MTAALRPPPPGLAARLWAYRRLRRERGAGVVSALLCSLLQLLAWALLRFETPVWQALLARSAGGYAHLEGRPLRPGDPLRYALQTLWLLLWRPEPVGRPLRPRALWVPFARFGAMQRGALAALQALRPRPAQAPWRRAEARLKEAAPRWRRVVLLLVGALTVLLAALCITTPFDYAAQVSFVVLLWGMAMLVRHQPGRYAVLLLILLSTIVSCRYLWWRYTATLNWNSSLDLVCGLLLLAAESYSWLILLLGYAQTCWPLGRQPAALPADLACWPSVDLLIPTYNEDLEVVRNTVYAALGIDWPADKLRIYILDDGKRGSFRRFADEVGVGYITRSDNRHAKAGNLNHALTRIDGELVAIFDCDHVPVRSFLQLTAGWFLRDPRLALVQTPHHFFSPDPFERNLGVFRRMPNEGELFYGLVQDGNDLWNAAFFCGSCALLRRAALDAIGGFAVETVTEDAHTALRLHRHGWNSAYLRIPQAAGLATESLSAHIGQRIRWARGMAQIFRTDNPLLGRGLRPLQRLCYANAMLHFLAGLPRLVFLTAPLAFLLLHAYIIYAPAAMIVLQVLPHVVLASLANARLQGAYRRSFWGEVYETVLAWYIAWPTAAALLAPSKGKFNVTAKGGLMNESQFDWHITRPYLVLAALNFAGLGFAVWRLCYGPPAERATVVVSALWVLYNLLIVGAAMAVAAEARQIRQNHRVPTRLPAALRLADGRLFGGELLDYSSGGAGLELPLELGLAAGTPVWLLLRRGNREFAFAGRLSHCLGRHLGIRFEALDRQQQIDLVQCTFARADAWLDWQPEQGEERPLHSFLDVLAVGLDGYVRLVEYAPRPLRPLIVVLMRLLRWIASFLPRLPRPAQPSSRSRALPV
jgi:cellulose synthase (UDP-forming)